MKKMIAFIVCVFMSSLLTAQTEKLSDKFDTDSLKNWQRVFQTDGSKADQLKTIEVKDGKLHLVPHAVVWYKDWRGPLVYKEVTGDFVITMKVKVSNRAGTGAPNSLFSLAGIMIRKPRNISQATWQPGGENYVFLSTGSANKKGQWQLETKTTVNSDSKLKIHNAPSGEATLRVVRKGANLVLLYQAKGQPWHVVRRLQRHDFPETLQAGVTCYTDWKTCEKVQPKQHNYSKLSHGKPDLKVEVDEIIYQSIDEQFDITAGDSDLIKALGE